MQGTFQKNDGLLDWYNDTGSAVVCGQVVVVGTIVGIVTGLRGIAAADWGTLAISGHADFVKDTGTAVRGDSIYWHTTGSPVGGVASSGAANGTASGGTLIGLCETLSSLTGDATMRVVMTSAQRTATIAGSVTADDITGSDSSLGIAGLSSTQGGAVALLGGPSSTSANAGGAVTTVGGTPGATGVGGAVTLTGAVGGATSGAGGPVSATGGAGTAGNSAGGAVGVTGGAGQGSAAGGQASVVGGAGGATGAGGAILVTAGAGGATSGTGGALTIAAGAGSGGNANGGALTLRGGAKNGSGANGAIAIGDSNTASITMGVMPRIPTGTVAAAGTVQGDAGALIEGFNLVSAADGTKGVRLPLAVAGMQVIVKCNANAVLKVWPGVGDAINAIAGDAAMSLASGLTAARFTAYDATTWYTDPLLPS